MRSCFFIFPFLVWLTAGCTAPVKQESRVPGANSYAKGFKIEKFKDFTKLAVLNPWERVDNIEFEYYLCKDRKDIPDFAANIIKIPVRRVVCLSTTHIAYLDAIGETGSVVGVSGSRYINNQELRQRLEKGEVYDVGYGHNLDYELIVSRQPGLVMVYGIGSEVTASVHKLKELGIPAIIVAEYLEESPLGKAEWIKFVGSLFEKEDIAEELFRNIENKYLELKELTAELKYKPKVLVGSPYHGSWWVPGGNSYLANIITDAGGEYLGKSNLSHESYIISFENALIWGNEADIWINMGNMLSKREIAGSDKRLSAFKVFQEGKIFNNINRLSRHGGNDFWESGTVNPHLILNDLIIAFHPELLNGKMNYYKEIR